MKKKIAKWSVDKNWNIIGEGRFFNVSDIKCIYFFEEKETCSLWITFMGFRESFGYSIKEKNSVIKIRDWLQSVVNSYQESIRKHHNDRHRTMEKMVKFQEKVLKCHE